MNKYDPANWLKHSKESVYHTAKQGTLIKLDVEYLSPLLLVRWTRNNYKEPVFGFLEAEIISPLGRPSPTRQEFEVVTDKDHYQFWSVANDGLPYKLHARLIQNPKLSTHLEIQEYIPLINSHSLALINNMGIVNQPNTTDFTPVVNAIAVSGQQQAAATAGMQARLDQIAAAETPATRSAFAEVTVKAFTGATSGSSVAPADTNRPKVIISYPRKNAAGQANNTICYLACGNVQRQGISNYDYILSAGASVTLDEEEAMAMIAIWHEPTQGNQNQDVVLNLSTFTR